MKQKIILWLILVAPLSWAQFETTLTAPGDIISSSVSQLSDGTYLVAYSTYRGTTLKKLSAEGKLLSKSHKIPDFVLCSQDCTYSQGMKVYLVGSTRAKMSDSWNMWEKFYKEHRYNKKKKRIYPRKGWSMSREASKGPSVKFKRGAKIVLFDAATFKEKTVVYEKKREKWLEWSHNFYSVLPIKSGGTTYLALTGMRKAVHGSNRIHCREAPKDHRGFVEVFTLSLKSIGRKYFNHSKDWANEFFAMAPLSNNRFQIAGKIYNEGWQKESFYYEWCTGSVRDVYGRIYDYWEKESFAIYRPLNPVALSLKAKIEISGGKLQRVKFYDLATLKGSGEFRSVVNSELGVAHLGYEDGLNYFSIRNKEGGIWRPELEFGYKTFASNLVTSPKGELFIAGKKRDKGILIPVSEDQDPSDYDAIGLGSVTSTHHITVTSDGEYLVVGKGNSYNKLVVYKGKGDTNDPIWEPVP